MSKYTQIHGAAWDDHIANSSSALGRGWSMEDGMGLLCDQTGFRLAFDSAEQRDRGGCWHYQPEMALQSMGGGANPSARMKTMGFRIAREDT